MQLGRNRKSLYGLSPEGFARMLEKQDNACAVCRKPLSPGVGRHVDHCHFTKKVRGILCMDCNIAIGRLKEDPELFRAALAYLEQNKR